MSKLCFVTNEDWCVTHGQAFAICQATKANPVPSSSGSSAWSGADARPTDKEEPPELMDLFGLFQDVIIDVGHGWENDSKSDVVSRRSGDSLLPCPFCGKPPGDVYIDHIDIDTDRFYVLCEHCDAQGPVVEAPSYQGDAKAIELWNRRAIVADARRVSVDQQQDKA